MILKPFDANDSAHVAALVALWNAACGANLAVTPRFVEYNMRGSTGAIQAGRIAIDDDALIGFVLASALPNDPQASPPEMGWVDAIAVAPECQRRGIGGELIAWAETWLREQGCARARLGGSLRPFAPGLPTELQTDAFFRARDYIPRPNGERVWDVARDLCGYVSTRSSDDVTIRPAQLGDADALRKFLWREFPNRWRYEHEEFLRNGGRITDWMILTTPRGVDGFAKLCFEDSLTPINRVYPWKLPRPWGQLGPIGVSADARGKGYGGALLDAALCHLRDQGVCSCVIDWTDLVDFYARFGFEPYREYLMLIKNNLRDE
jgi:GNAT superfamily N-acetyltransferase